MDGNTSGELRNLIRCLVAGGSFSLNLKKLRKVRRGEGASLLRTNLTVGNPEELWKQSIVLTEVEQALKELKNDLDIRPIYHQKDDRISHRRDSKTCGKNAGQTFEVKSKKKALFPPNGERRGSSTG